MADDNPLISSLQRVTSGKGSSSGGGTAVADDDEENPLLASLKRTVSGKDHVPGKVTPFAAAVPTTSATDAGAATGAPMIKLAPPQTPQTFDAAQIPRSPFTNRLMIPQPTPEQVDSQNKAEDAANQGALTERTQDAKFGLTPEQVTAHDQDAAKLMQTLSTGSRKMPIPAFTGLDPVNPDKGQFGGPTGVRMSNVGELEDLANENLNRPDIPKSRGEAFFTGMASDTVKTVNDMFLSPIGIAASGLGLTEATALAKAGQFGGDAAKLAQDYEAMRAAGASGAELADVEAKMKATIATAAKAQKAAVLAGKAGVGAAVGFGAQGAGGVAKGIQDRDLSEVLGGAGQMALGVAAGAGAENAGGIEEQVKANTAARVKESLKGQGDVSAQRTPQVPAQSQGPQVSPLSPAVTGGEMPEGHIGPEHEPLAPEKPKTLQAQTDALAKGTNKTVYFPKGTENLPEPPENAKVTIVPGEQAGAGTWYHTADVKPLTILKAVQNGTFGQLLGNHQSKESAMATGAPAAVVARDKDGNELKASLVDANAPTVVAAQRATLQSQFPKAEITVEKPQDVVGDRLGKKPAATLESANATLGEQLKPWTQRLAEQQTTLQAKIDDPKTSAVDRSAAEAQMRKLGQGRRKADVGPPEGQDERRQPPANAKPVPGQAATIPEGLGNQPRNGAPRTAPKSKVSTPAPEMQPVIAQHAEQFKTEAKSLTDIDPTLAQGLQGMAEGKYHTPEHLKQFVQERVADANTKADLTKILADHSAAVAAAPERNTGSKSRVAPGIPVQQVRGQAAPVRENAVEARAKLGVPGGKRVKKITNDEILAEAYKPGNIVKGYGNAHDKVLEFLPADESKPYPYNHWNVRVQGLDKNGNPIPGDIRLHSTAPEKEEIAAAKKRIEEARAAAPVVPAKKAKKGTELSTAADKVRKSDAPLAGILDKLSTDDTSAIGDLRSYVKENVSDVEQRKEFNTAIDAAESEAHPSTAGNGVSEPAEASAGAPKESDAEIREQESERPAEGIEAKPAEEPAENAELHENENVAPSTVGDRVQINEGALKGKTAEVTSITPEGGVYVRGDENSRVRYVKKGDFEAAKPEEKPAERPKLSSTTAYSNPLFDPELWKGVLGYLKPSEAAGQADLRERTGGLARAQAVLQEKLRAEHNRWRGRSDSDMLAFADLVENGEADRKARGVTLAPKTQAMLDAGKKNINTQDKNLAATLRTLLDEGRSAVQALGTGKLQNFIENYFPHMWEQKGSKAGAALGQVFGKKPLEGSKSFLKTRTIPTTAEGFDKDLKPVTTNPVDMAVLKMHEMNRYVMAHRLLDDLKSAGSAKFVGFGQKAPDGWRPLDDKVFKGMINRGRYYAPEDIAQPINRYVATGLRGVPIYDIIRSFGNSLNQVQLGLSGFHLGTTSLNAIISQFSLAAKQLAHGQVLSAAKNFATAPAAPIRNLIQGGNVLRDYLRPDQAKKYEATAKAVEQAGGRSGMGEEYIDNRVERMLQSFANKKYFKGALQAIPAAVEMQAIPVLKWIVPRMKLGAFHDLAADILERGQKKGWSQEKIRSEMQKSWDSIDNRFGQVVYDNLNWNKVAKDLAFIGVRSVGWNYGTWRELGGGARDFAAQAGQALNGKGFDVSDRMAYMFMLPLTIAAAGALYMLAHTGKGPQSAKDFFYPKNGKTEEDGTEARASLPSYMKDVFAMAEHPVDTALHKANPAIGLITEMIENKDYYGNEIRNSDDPIVMQLGQALKHIGSSFLPFTFRNQMQRSKIGEKGVESTAENVLGITPAPRNVERTDAETMAHELIQRRSPAGAHTTAEQKKQDRIFELEQEARSGKLTREALKAKLDSGEVTEQDAITAIKRSRTPGLVRAFKELTIPEALKVWEVASPKERGQLQDILETKVQNGFQKLTREDQDRYRPLLRNALTGQQAPSRPPVGAPMRPPMQQNLQN